MYQVIAYIDGYNLYYGLRSKNWQKYYWLNLREMVQRLLRPDQVLARVKYFTTRVKQPADKRRRQALYLEALQTLNDFEIYYGHFLDDTVTCGNCGHSWHHPHEKMTDVNIAVQLMCDAFQGVFDTALLVSADGDLVGPIDAVRTLFPSKWVVVAFPPNRYSRALEISASKSIHIGRRTLAKSCFPEQVTTASGHILQRPASWS